MKLRNPNAPSTRLMPPIVLLQFLFEQSPLLFLRELARSRLFARRGWICRWRSRRRSFTGRFGRRRVIGRQFTHGVRFSKVSTIRAQLSIALLHRPKPAACPGQRHSAKNSFATEAPKAPRKIDGKKRCRLGLNVTAERVKFAVRLCALGVSVAKFLSRTSPRHNPLKLRSQHCQTAFVPGHKRRHGDFFLHRKLRRYAFADLFSRPTAFPQPFLLCRG